LAAGKYHFHEQRMLGDEDFRLVCSHGVILSESCLKTLCFAAGNKPFSSDRKSVK
jgi:hypothetical protein